MARPRSRAARRHQDLLRKDRRLRRVRDALGRRGETLTTNDVARRWRVTVPANAPDEDARKQVRDLFLDALRGYSELNAEPAKLKHGVLAVSVEVYAVDEQIARMKALYWCQQAARRVHVIRWHPPAPDLVKVEAV